MTTGDGVWTSLRAGLRYAARDRVLGPILLVVTVLNLALAAPLNVGVALLANSHGWKASGFSAILVGFGVGAALGSLSMTRYRPKRHPATIGLIWVAGNALCLAGLGLSTTLPVAVAASALLGLTTGPASALLLGLVQARAQTAFLGRVMALVHFSALGLVPVSYTVFGGLTQATNLTTAFLICAIAELITAGLALGFKTVRTATLTTSSGDTPA